MKNLSNKIGLLIESALNELYESDKDPGLTSTERKRVESNASAAKKAQENKALDPEEVERLDKAQGGQAKAYDWGSGDPDSEGITPSPHVPSGLLKMVGDHLDNQ